jgi:hypothetical protein
MFAILPLLGGFLVGRFMTRRAAIAVQIVFYAIATLVLVATSPTHGATHTSGALLALILLPLSAGALLLGQGWQRRAQRTA